MFGLLSWIFGFTGGEIRGYKLTRWWKKAFSKRERKYMRKRCSQRFAWVQLDRGPTEEPYQPVYMFLANLSIYFCRDDDLHIAQRIVDKAMTYADQIDNYEDKHFFYEPIIGFYEMYVDHVGDEELVKELLMRACLAQVSISSYIAKEWKKENGGTLEDFHIGYFELTNLLRSEKMYHEAIRVARRAKRQGWQGDWDEFIADCKDRYKKKI